MISSKPAAVIGSGPNGLAAAVTLARAGVPVTVFEAEQTIGGGTRTTELVQPGVLHDVCSAIHPMALATGFFNEFEIEQRVQFTVPNISYANPTDSGTALAYKDLEKTVTHLGTDGPAYRSFYEPLLARLSGVIDFAVGGSMIRLPKNILAAVTTGLRTLEQGSPLWNIRFKEELAPALLSGVAAHSIGPLPNLATSAVGVVLGALGHATGWPVPNGGSISISKAMEADLLAHGGTIETGHPINSIEQLDDFGALIFDTSARGLAQIAGSKLPAGYVRKLLNFKYGDGATKVDFVLDGPIPWADERIHETATVHLGGSRAETAYSEKQVAKGQHPERPYVLLAQPTAFDPGRNASGVNAVWSYAHVPKGSTFNMTDRVINQIERFAPGFRDRIVAVKQTSATELSEYNRNYHGGDFSAGAINLPQLLARPTLTATPWKTPTKGIYLGSSSTPPGPGVHGLSGWYAAKLALRHEYGLSAPNLSNKS